MTKPNPLISVSPSKLQCADCPHKFYQDYLAPDAGRMRENDHHSPLPLIVGRVHHQVLDGYTKSLRKMQVPSDMELLEQIFDATWNIMGDRLPNSLYDAEKETMIAFGEGFALDLNHLWESEKDIALTWEMEPCEFDGAEAWLRAKLDRIEIFPDVSMARITDYKTQRYIPSETKLKAAMQTKIYPFLLHKLNPYLTQFEMVYHYTRWNKKVTLKYVLSNPGEGENLLEVDKTERQLRAFSLRMAEKINNPETTWEAITGENCGICRHNCPLIVMGIKPLQENQDAVSVAMQIEALGDKLKKLKTQLQDYAKSSGERVDIGSGYYEYGISTSLTGLKASRIAQYCTEKGIDVDKVLSVDTAKLKKIEDDEIRDEITAMGKIKESTRFKFVETAVTDKEDE